MDPTQSGSTQGSPFIRGDISLVPPSPELNPSSHYGSVLDFPTNVLGSPNLGDNSGSFHGSPYSHHSDLSFVTAEGDLSFELFSDHEGVSGFDNLGSAGLHQPGSDFDYDPLDFDAPGSANSLMIYDTDYMSPPPFGSPSPDQQGGRSGSVPFDYPSPGSTNDDGNDRRSRASSVSSAHRAQQSGQYYHSPRLDVAQSFENMTVRSPSWGVQGLPQTQAPQQHKAPSPPRLVMPDGHDQPPTINAPDDLDGGPQLHIVPATPIGVPGASGMGAHFQDPLNTLNHGSEIASNQPSWAQPTTIKSSESRQASPFRYPANLPDDTSNNRHSDFLGSVNANPTAPFLFPQQQRHRSKSDNALDPPTWDNNFVQQQLQQQQGDNSALGLDLESAGNVDDNGMNTASSTSSANANNSAAFTMQTFQFGGGGFLSPNSHDFNGMRRAKSENGQRMGHRQSRSEDIRGLQHTGMQLPPQQQQQQQQFTLPHSNPNSNFGHGHSLSLSASRGPNLLFPPSNEFGMPQNPNLLSTNTLPIPSRASSPGHIRRASSGTRSGRGIGAESWSAEYGGTTVSSARVSPYPSPNASPRVGGRELDLDLGREDQYTIPDGVPSAGFENEVALSGRMALNAQAAASVHQGTIPGMGTMPMGVGNVPPVAVVSKPNVTTLRTANASHKRRKQEASFVCPFPGCGSTFTRSFNLKGHIRSHNEEKPFVCHWPGCGKGFARQHDCKRHEQLHTNYRPFTCEGCNRNFARMDALNRHLRSEGGTECAKLQPQGGSNASSSPGSAAQSPPPADKPAQQGHQRTTSRQEGSPNLNPKETGGLIFQPNTGWNPMSGAGTAVGVSL